MRTAESDHLNVSTEICQISYGIANNWAIIASNSLMIVLSVLGTVGNVTFLALIQKRKSKFHPNIRLLLRNMAVANILHYATRSSTSLFNLALGRSDNRECPFLHTAVTCM